MKIKLAISTATLGKFNTDRDNQRYADAVLAELQSEYPGYDVSVDLVKDVYSNSCWVSDDSEGEIRENVNMIANRVWDKSDY